VKYLDILFLIPARRDSKGLPDKNIKKLKGKPLIEYTIDFAKKNQNAKDIICVTTNDCRIKKIIDIYKRVDLIDRPENLSQDTTSMEEVINHCIEYYEKRNFFFNSIILLQPTSPLRKKIDFLNLKSSYNETVDMVVSVKKSKENPYYLLYEENKDGFLKKSKELNISRRQDAPNVYCLNGSFFMFNINSIKNKSIQDFTKIIKVEMPAERSIDVDDEMDWKFLKFLIKNKVI
tara:strand:+ start:979 stop:1677 length:699 start_codon:yes stop_codon:yes gene_type:complete